MEKSEVLSLKLLGMEVVASGEFAIVAVVIVTIAYLLYRRGKR